MKNTSSNKERTIHNSVYVSIKRYLKYRGNVKMVNNEIEKMPVLENDFQKEYNPSEFYKFLTILFGVGVDLVTQNIAGVIKDIIDYDNNKKVENFIKDLYKRIDALEDNVKKLSLEKMATKDGQRLLHFSMVRISRCFSDEQINKIVSTIEYYLKLNIITEQEAEIIIDLLTEFNSAELELVQELSNTFLENVNIDDVDIYNTDIEFSKLPNFKDKQSQITFIRHRLEGKGLLVTEPRTFPAEGTDNVNYLTSGCYFLREFVLLAAIIKL